MVAVLVWQVHLCSFSLCIKLYIFFSKGENSARIGDIYSCSINYYYALKPNILSSICYYSVSTCDFFVNFTGQIQTHLWPCCAFQHMDIQRLLLSVYTGCSVCNDNSVKETLLHLNVALFTIVLFFCTPCKHIEPMVCLYNLSKVATTNFSSFAHLSLSFSIYVIVHLVQREESIC